MKNLTYILLISWIYVVTCQAQENILMTAQNGDAKQMEELLDSGVDINSRDEFGRTPLMYAAEQKNLQMVQFLIDKDADVQAKDNYGFTVIDLVKSMIQRSGSNKEKMMEAMRRQGLSEESVNELMKASTNEQGTEQDREKLEEIFALLEKSVKGKQNK